MGLGIFRIQKLTEARFEISSANHSQQVGEPQLVPEVTALLGDKSCFLQQGIDLATYKNCPFDIRIVLQKPYKVWRLTLTSAKVANREDAVVTNVAQGAMITPSTTSSGSMTSVTSCGHLPGLAISATK